MPLKDVLIAMDRIGFTDVILPFILVFTVVFAVLQRSKVLGVNAKGAPKSNYNAMVAFVLAFFVLIMVRTLNVITWFTRYLALLLVAFVLLGVIFSFLGVREHHKNTLMFVALMLIIFVLFEVLAFTGAISDDVLNRLLIPLLLVVFLVGSAYMLLKKEKPAAAAPAAQPASRPAREAPAQPEMPELSEEEHGELQGELGRSLQNILQRRQQRASPRAR